MEPPETRYTTSGDIRIAYQVTGKGARVRDPVAGSGLAFRDRGFHALKGLPEELRLYAALAEG